MWKSQLARRYALILAGTFVSIMICAGLIEMHFKRDEVATQVFAIQRQKVITAKSRIEDYLVRIEQSGLQMLSALELADKSVVDSAPSELRRLMTMQPALQRAALINRDGSSVAATSRVDGDTVNETPLNLANMELAWKNGVGYAHPTFIDGIEPTVLLIVHKAEFTEYAIAMSLNLRFVMDVIATIGQGSNISLYVTDETFDVVAHSDPRRRLGKINVSMLSHLRKQNFANKNDIHNNFGVSLDDKPVLATVLFMPNANWWIVLEEDKESAMALATSAVTRSTTLIGVASIGVMVVGLWIAAIFAAPVISITRAAKQIGLGKFDIKVKHHRDDELGALATEFNNMAAQLQDYTQNLEQKVADKTQQLELANKHKSEFLANMSHELRTPLNAVIGFSDALREEYFGSLNDKQREYVNDIAASGQHLLSLINDILDLSKIEAGKMELECSSFSITAAIDNAMILIRERALRQNVTVTSEIGDGVDLLYADERKFKQVLINLLTNAVKFTYPNGWVKICAVIEGANLKVSVADSGLGIAEEDFETVFQEFRQLTTVGEAKHEGTGLGLPLAKRIVELHGGLIWLESELGKGATFSFLMPLDGAGGGEDLAL
jgi:signal transduction histidine kinase